MIFWLLLPLLKEVRETNRHIIDLPWRLSSPQMQTGLDARIWVLSNGTAVGFAAWQHYWATLDFFIKPGIHEQHIQREIFEWATSRFKTLDNERGFSLPYWVEYLKNDRERESLMQEQGYHLDDAPYVRLLHSMNVSSTGRSSVLPDGFVLRPLAGISETEDYTDVHRAAFKNKSMTREWRERTRVPTYRPELDLVVIAPNGKLAGFAVGWWDEARRHGQVEPCGVHPEYEGFGLGRALMTELMCRFKNLGAMRVIVEPSSNQLEAIRFYQSLGLYKLVKLYARIGYFPFRKSINRGLCLKANPPNM